MYKKSIITICLILGVCFSCTAQRKGNNSKSILIYSEGQGFLQPYIETTIKNLINTKTDSLYFKQVNSLNTFISDTKYQAILADLIGTQKPEDVKLRMSYSKEEKEIKKDIFNTLINYDYFLAVKTNTLGELIEFQFQLFSTVKANPLENEKNIPTNIADKVIKVENFFINPKTPNYLNEIKDAIQRLIFNSNKKPEAELKIFNEIVNTNDTLFIPLNSIIFLDGSNSGDYDSDNIQYVWRNIPTKNEKYQTFNKLIFNDSEPIQKIIVKNSGEYNIGFKVYDGVQYSDEIILKLKTIIRPKIIVKDSIIVSNVYNSIFEVFRNKSNNINYHKEKINFTQDLWKDLGEDRIIVSNKKLNDKLNIENEKFIDTTSTIRVLEKGGGGEIYINSKVYYPDFDDDRIIYLYSVGPQNLLSKPTELLHRFSVRTIFNIKTKYVMNVLTLPMGSEDYLDFNHSISTPTLCLGMYLTKNFEFDLSIPFLSKKLQYQGIEFDYPNTCDFSINYHNFSIFRGGIFNNVYAGINYKRYSGKYIEMNRSNDNSVNISGIGFSAGVNYGLIKRKNFQASITYGFGFSRFLNSEFSRLREYSLNIGFNLSF